VLLRQGKSLKVAPAGAEIKRETATAVPIEDVSIQIDPRAEWRQILREAWRAQPRFFLRAELSRRRLERDVEEVRAGSSTTPRNRSDVHRIMAAMASELRVGPQLQHAGRIDRQAAECRHRVARRGLRSRRWTLIASRRSTAGLIGVPTCARRCVRLGSPSQTAIYLLAVDGKQLTAERNVYSAFENTDREARRDQRRAAGRRSGTHAL
jgi:tricorn protease